jgi:TolA-binding protein
VLREGKSKSQSGALVEAEGLLQIALADAKIPWVKEYAAFYLGQVQRQLGRSSMAIKAYEQVLATKPDSRFLPQVRLGIAQCHTAEGKYDEAASVLEAFAKEVDTLKLPRSFALETQRSLGQVQLKRGNFAEAARRFEGVATEAKSLFLKATDEEKPSLRRLELLATRDRATAMIGDKKFAEAEALLASLRNEKEDLARAIHLIGQGEVLLGKGDPDRARVLLSQAVVTSPAAQTELPRALLLLGTSYLALKDKGERGAAKMASIYQNNVVQRYAGTDEAKAAEALQKRL